MSDVRSAGRHSAPTGTAPPSPDGVDPDEVWVPPAYEPARPGDFVEYTAGGFEVKRTHRGLTVALLLILVAALAGSGWYIVLRDRHDGTPVPTCAQAEQSIAPTAGKALRLTEGGAIPKGIPVPSAAPARTCTMSVDRQAVTVAVWTSTSESDYSSLLASGGWLADRTVRTGTVVYTVHRNPGSGYSVATTSDNGVLVALYAP